MFDFKAAMEWGKKKEGMLKPELTIKAPADHTITKVTWGALDKTIYYCTDRGRLIHYDVQNQKLI